MVLLQALFAKAQATNLKVSPSGGWLGWLARGDSGVLNLWVAPLPLAAEPAIPGDIPGAIQLTAAVDRDICFSFHFAADDSKILYLRETEHGTELYHLYSLDLAGPIPVQAGRDLLAEHPALTASVGFVGGLQLWLPASRPSVAILATGAGSLLWDLSQLDLETGELVTLHQNPCSTWLGRVSLLCHALCHAAALLVTFLVRNLTAGLVSVPAERLAGPPAAPVQYFVGRSGELVGSAECCLSANGIALRFSQRTRRGAWHPVCPVIPFAALNMQLVGSGAASGTLRFDVLDDGQSVALHTCAAHDTTSYVKYPSGETLAHDLRADIDGFIANPASGVVEAVVVTAELAEIVPVGDAGERLKRELRRLEAEIAPSGVQRVMLASRTRADDVWILRTSSATNSSVYYLARPYAERAEARRLLAARPVLSSLRLSPTTSVKIAARDGESLPAYLTLPVAGSEQANGGGPRPLALVLHGGPSARDYAGFDPLVQLLASLGVAVLSVNYRGSTGFGQRFAKLGNGALRGMHNDVEDARRWAVDAGVADPARVAVVGASWGGYLALGAATSIADPLPDEAPAGGSRYAAVVAIVPLVSVGAANDSPAFRGDPLVKRYWRQIYGDKVSDDRAAAELLSPVHRLEQLRGNRLLLIHGESDPRVPRAHGDAVAAAAKRLGLEGAHLTYAREGHSIRREKNVLHMHHALEVFLCGALGLPAPPPLDAGLCEGNGCTVHWASPPELF